MPARWLTRTAFVVSLAALAVATYLTVARYVSPDVLVCSSSGVVDCAKVTTSAQSTFLGIPVAVLGVIWSLAAVALCGPWAWRPSSGLLTWARLALVGGGVAFVLWLLYAELFVIRAICLWCTAMHVLVFVLFALVVFAAVSAEPEAR
jgi:uncharacterized membrane protein